MDGIDDGDWVIEWRKDNMPSRQPPGPPLTFAIEPLLAFLRARADDAALPAGVTQLRPTPPGPRVAQYVEIMEHVAAVAPEGPVLDELKRATARVAEDQYGGHPDFREEWRLPR